MTVNSSTKKEDFLKEVSRLGCAVLVGPMISEYELKNLPEAPLLLVDGGAREALKHGLPRERSNFSVGDGDSGGIHLDEKLPAEKDYTDLSYALKLLPKEVKKIFLIGFLGGRKDHELINFGEVHQLLSEKDLPCVATFSPETTMISSGEWQINHHGTFSLMAFKRAALTLKGHIKYPLLSETELLPLHSLGLSNEAEGEFTLKTNSPLMIYGDGVKVNFE